MKPQLLRSLLVLALLVCSLAVGIFVGVSRPGAHASSCSVWYRCPVSQFYGHLPGHWSLEHGTDLLTHGLVITAFLSGTVTFVREMPWDEHGVEDITWRLDKPWLAKGFRYGYVQIRRGSSYVHVGQHISMGTRLGVSDDYMEFGLSKSWAYGWAGDWSLDWTTDPRFLLTRL